MSAEAIAEALHLARSSVARWLAAAGLSRLRKLEPAEPVVRYQRQRPGELIHIGIKKLGRVDRPGHRLPASAVSIAIAVLAGTSFTSRSLTRRVWLMWRPCPTSGSPAPPAF